MAKRTIGIIGCGFIGGTLGRYAVKELSDSVGSVYLFDAEGTKAKALSEALGGAGVCASIEDLAVKADLLIESASPAAVPAAVRSAISASKDIMVISVGGFLGNESLLDEARRKGISVFLPSGAISGIDAVKAARIAGIESVTITTRKGPKSLAGAPYLAEKGIDVEKIKGETVVFEGSALEAVKNFPKNINVSALLSLAGIGPEKTKVRIVVSPEYTKNIHEIEVTGKAGRIVTRSENVPSPDNPRTSYLAALACMTSLREYFDTVRIGT